MNALQRSIRKTLQYTTTYHNARERVGPLPVGRLDGLVLEGAQGAQAPHLIRLQELAHVRAPGSGMPGLALLHLLRRVQHTYVAKHGERV